MPQFNDYEADGRKLMVQFTCTRCEATHTEPLELHKDDDHEHYGYLRAGIHPPSGWAELFHGPLLCPDCARDYEIFMQRPVKRKEAPQQ